MPTNVDVDSIVVRDPLILHRDLVSTGKIVIAQTLHLFRFIKYRKTPLLAPGVDQFSNANSFVLYQLTVETNTVLKSSFSPLLHQVLCLIIRHLN